MATIESGVQCFGNPASLQALGSKLQRTGTGMDQVCADARREAWRLEPNWRGPASDDFRRFITDQLAAVLATAGASRRFSDTVFTLEKGLAAAMRQFQAAEQWAWSSGCFINPATLQVVCPDPDPAAQANARAIQAMVVQAQDMAAEARTEAMVQLDGIEQSDGWLADLPLPFGLGRRAAPGTSGTTRPPGARNRVPAATPRPAVNWDRLKNLAEQPAARKKENGFASWSARDGQHEVTIVQGRVGDPISQSDSFARYTSKIPGEHGTHSVGMQLGENLPEGITSGPAADLNLGPLKQVENATRSVYDQAAEMGATVETRTTLQIEHRVAGGQDVPVLVGVQREAWIRFPGSDNTFTFANFDATIDPVTRQVDVLRNDVLRPTR